MCQFILALFLELHFVLCRKMQHQLNYHSQRQLKYATHLFYIACFICFDFRHHFKLFKAFSLIFVINIPWFMEFEMIYAQKFS